MMILLVAALIAIAVAGAHGVQAGGLSDGGYW